MIYFIFLCNFLVMIRIFIDASHFEILPIQHGQNPYIDISYDAKKYQQILKKQHDCVVHAFTASPGIVGRLPTITCPLPDIVFMANAFALMGLRQLYFLVGILLRRLVYLSKGLSIVLGFIGIKLIIEALHGIGIHEIAGFEIPHVSLAVSLGVIISALSVTTVISLRKNPGHEPDPLHQAKD